MIHKLLLASEFPSLLKEVRHRHKEPKLMLDRRTLGIGLFLLELLKLLIRQNWISFR